MGRSEKLAKNISFITIGNIGSKLVGFIMLPFYTAWLSPADYGITDLLTVYAHLMLNVVACDMGDAICIFPIGANEQKIRQYYSTGFFFQIACSVACLCLFCGMSLLHLSGTFGENLWFIYGILISALFQTYTQNFCRGINKMAVFSYTGILQTGTIAFFSFLLIPALNVYGFVLATILSNIISTLFTFLYSRSYRYLSFRAFDCASLREMLQYSVPLIPTTVMWWLISGLNRPLLEEYVGLFALGLIAVAGKLPNVMNLVFNLFQQAWIVTVVEEYKKPDFSRYFNKMFRMIIAVQVAVCLLIIMFSETFIDWMTTDEFYEAWKYIPLLAIAVLFGNTTGFLGTVFSATRKSKYTFYSVIMGGMAAVLFNFLLIPYLGIWGACLSICLSHVITVTSRIYFSRKLVKFTGRRYLFGEVLILACAYFAALFLEHWSLIFVYVSCLLLYFYINRQTILNIKEFALNKIVKKK